MLRRAINESTSYDTKKSCNLLIVVCWCVTSVNNTDKFKKHNECSDDGRGDSSQLRPVHSPPRPSIQTLEDYIDIGVNQMNFNTFLILIIGFSLTACSNTPHTVVPSTNSQAFSNPQNLRSDYIELLSADEELDIKLNNKKSMSEWDILEQENKIRPLANKKCLVPYKNRLNKILDFNKIKAQPTKEQKLSKYKELLRKSHQEAIILDTAIPSCLQPLGVSGEIKISYKNQYYSAPQYIQLIINKTDQMASMPKQQSNIASDFLSEFAGGMLAIMEGMAASGTNNNQHYVSPYVRRDGTYVDGYYRTNPNGTCSDNRNGC